MELGEVSWQLTYKKTQNGIMHLLVKGGIKKYSDQVVSRQCPWRRSPKNIF